MSKRAKADNSWPVFVGVDRLGIPLEDAIEAAVRQGWTPDGALFDFSLGAAGAGWSKRKIHSAVREAIGNLKRFHTFDEGWLFWADGAFDDDQTGDDHSVTTKGQSQEVSEPLPVADQHQGSAGGTEDQEGE